MAYSNGESDDNGEDYFFSSYEEGIVDKAEAHGIHPMPELAQGRFYLFILFQDEHWRDIHGKLFSIEDMDTHYIGNVLNYQLRNANRFKAQHVLDLTVSIDEDMSEGTFWALTHSAAEIELMDPKEWMRSTPLFRKLISEIGEDVFGG